MMMRRLFFCGTIPLFVLLVWAHMLHAASSDTFRVSQSVINPDSEPPTIPTNLTATPTTPTQIDLSWDPSSDNINVEGYQVFRDSSQVATTSLTSFSDVGLTPSTTYSYTVTAFDNLFNISTPTAPVATTTPPQPATSTPTTTPTTTVDTTVPRLEDPRILDVTYDALEHSIDLQFSTNVLTIATVRWGRTSSFEEGYTSTDIYRKDHQTLITGLSSGTLYELEITVIDLRQRKEFTRTLTVRTLAGPDVEPPANPTNFRATLVGGVVQLTWSNPDDADFSHVRILSSDQFYPTHIADGWLVFEGRDLRAWDERELADGQKRYYTIFAYDEAGNISSGAVTTIVRGFLVSPGNEEFATSTPIYPPTFEFSDIQFIQDDVVIRPESNHVRLNAREATTVLLPYELVPEHLKTIVVTLAHPTEPDTVFSFLLRINRDRTAYEARIGPLLVSGEYPMSVDVFDYNTQELFTVNGLVGVYETTLQKALSKGGVTGVGSITERLVFSLFLLFVCVALYYYLLQRRSRERVEG